MSNVFMCIKMIKKRTFLYLKNSYLIKLINVAQPGHLNDSVTKI